MTGLHPQRVDHLLDLLKHAKRMDYLQHLLVVPLHADVEQSCETIAQVLLLPSERKPCAPFVSQFRGKRLGQSARRIV